MRTHFRLFLSCLFGFALPLVSGFGSENDAPLDEQDRKPGERMVLKIQDIEYAFRWCPAGTFTMGSPQDEHGHRGDEGLQSVTLSHGFWMLETEVTQEMWEKVMGNNPSHFKGAKLPVEMVSWNDCQEYIKKLNDHLAGTLAAPAGFKFSLPTEAQWEYACRAGTTTAYHFGNTLTPEQANFGGNVGRTSDIGSYPANAWGLRDMHGNVHEWCADWYYFNNTDPSGAVTYPMWAFGSHRVIRGGCWGNPAEPCRSAHRGLSYPSDSQNHRGLRLALVAVKADRAELPLPSFLTHLPQPYGQMGTQVWEAITQGNDAEADRIAQECIKLAETQGRDPNVICFMHLTFGRVFLEASMFDSANRHAAEVVKHGGDDVNYLYFLALCTAKSGDVDGGISMLLDEIDRIPPVRDVLLSTVPLLLDQVKPLKPSDTMFETIDSLMNRVETEKPVSPEAITALVDYWIVRGNPERAILLYEEGLTRDNLDDTWVFMFRNDLATLYSLVLGQHQKALEVVDQALATNRDNVTWLNTKGLILINAGNPTEAIPVLLRVVELSNHHPLYCMHFAYALHLEGRDAESRRYFDAGRDKFFPHFNRIMSQLVNEMNKEMYDALLLAHP